MHAIDIFLFFIKILSGSFIGRGVPRKEEKMQTGRRGGNWTYEYFIGGPHLPPGPSETEHEPEPLYAQAPTEPCSDDGNAAAVKQEEEKSNVIHLDLC